MEFYIPANSNQLFFVESFFYRADHFGYGAISQKHSGSLSV